MDIKLSQVTKFQHTTILGSITSRGLNFVIIPKIRYWFPHKLKSGAFLFIWEMLMSFTENSNLSNAWPLKQFQVSYWPKILYSGRTFFGEFKSEVHLLWDLLKILTLAYRLPQWAYLEHSCLAAIVHIFRPQERGYCGIRLPVYHGWPWDTDF